jgi:hypothetical protein
VFGVAWEQSEAIKEVKRLARETPSKVGLIATGFPVTINSEIEVELVSKEK